MIVVFLMVVIILFYGFGGDGGPEFLSEKARIHCPISSVLAPNIPTPPWILVNMLARPHPAPHPAYSRLGQSTPVIPIC